MSVERDTAVFAAYHANVEDYLLAISGDLCLVFVIKLIIEFMENNGVAFVLDNFEKALRLCKSSQEHKDVYRRISFEYTCIKNIKYTGNMIDHFEKFRGGNHKYAEDFAFLRNYGLLPNEEMSDYLKEHYPDEVNNKKTIDDLRIGETLSNGEIMQLFGVKYQGCERYSSKYNHMVLISDKSLNYNIVDDSKGTVDFALHSGDVNLPENRRLINFKQSQMKIYVFEYRDTNKFRYFGEVAVSGDVYQNRDNNHLMIPLARVDSSPNGDINRLELLTVKTSRRALTLPPPSGDEIVRKQTSSTDRDQAVKAYTRHRANGCCDLCGKKAPFTGSDGYPFLECHHIIYIKNGGPDRIYNTAALCPNCHKKIHNLKNAGDRNKIVLKLREYLKNDTEHPENLKFFNDLFGFKE